MNNQETNEEKHEYYNKLFRVLKTTIQMLEDRDYAIPE